jgi:hypothetical protein
MFSLPVQREVWTAKFAATSSVRSASAVTGPSLDRIIERLQFSIVDARALQLKMLEHTLSIALLEAIEAKDKSKDERDE